MEAAAGVHRRRGIARAAPALGPLDRLQRRGTLDRLHRRGTDRVLLDRVPLGLRAADLLAVLTAVEARIPAAAPAMPRGPQH